MIKINKWFFLAIALMAGFATLVLVGVFYHKLPFSFLDKNFQTRNPSSLNSVTLYTSEVESRSKQLMEKGRSLHKIENYKEANKVLSEVLEKYPYTGYIEELLFLLAKGLYYERQPHKSLSVIQKLKEYAPRSRSKWVGYCLLVKGKIYEQWGETQKAIEVYRQVLSQFNDYELINEAEDLLMDITL